MLKYLLLGVLLYSQSPTMTSEEAYQWQKDRLAEKEEAEESRKRALRRGSSLMTFKVVAQYQDGSPARGYVHCSGPWYKYQEDEWSNALQKMVEPRAYPNLPFKTDSRGVAFFHPSFNHYVETIDDDASDYFYRAETCHATAGVRSGKLTFTVQDDGTYVITIPGSGPVSTQRGLQDRAYPALDPYPSDPSISVQK